MAGEGEVDLILTLNHLEGVGRGQCQFRRANTGGAAVAVVEERAVERPRRNIWKVLQTLRFQATSQPCTVVDRAQTLRRGGELMPTRNRETGRTLGRRPPGPRRADPR